jgi:hypothetical protein
MNVYWVWQAGRVASGKSHNTEGRTNVDSQNVQTVVEQYFLQLQDRRNRHMLTEKYTRLSEASIEDIEKDAASWFSGFSAGIKLLNPNSALPRLEMVLGGITKSFETETAA